MNGIKETVPVSLGERSYDIIIGEGLIHSLGDHIGPLLPRPKTVIVTDDTVAEIWLERAVGALTNVGIKTDTIILPAGESTKSFAQLERLTSDLLKLDLERSDVVIALGGGVIGDLTGFAASILRRGMDFIQVPTTLLAQVDSSVGGKTGINTYFGKNLIGAFHQPRLVVADMGVLKTLSPRELRAGYAEVVKYGLIDDMAFFNWLEENSARLLDGDLDALAYAVALSCRSKARIVAADEREGGVRALLNLGHTFGHAYEAECGYDGSLLHGEAIALGMVLAFRLSEAMGVCPTGTADRIAAHLKSAGLPVKTSDLGRGFDTDKLIGHMRQDKKVIGGTLTFIIARGIGMSEVSRDVSLDHLRQVLDHA